MTGRELLMWLQAQPDATLDEEIRCVVDTPRRVTAGEPVSISYAVRR